MEEKQNIHVILLRTAAVLLILVMLTTSMVAGRYARYVTTATGSDSARVAKFSVSESGSFFTTISLKVSPGENATAEVVVKNDSEVAVEYRIETKNHYNNLPLEFSLRDGETRETALTLDPGEEKKLKLAIIWDESETDDKYIGMVDLVDVTIYVTQID